MDKCDQSEWCTCLPKVEKDGKEYPPMGYAQQHLEYTKFCDGIADLVLGRRLIDSDGFGPGERILPKPVTSLPSDRNWS